jgi:hypothetical protein
VTELLLVGPFVQGVYLVALTVMTFADPTSTGWW